MTNKNFFFMLIAVIVVSGLFGCSTTEFSPGPKGSLGPQKSLRPQGDISPQGNVGSSSDNAINIESTDGLVKVEYPLSGFTEIAVSDLFDVEIRQGKTYRVFVEAEETIAPYHDITVQGKTLQIGLDPNYSYNIESTRQRVEVTLPALIGVRVSDLSTLVLEDFGVEGTLQLGMADFGTLQGSITAGNVNVEVINHSELILRGSASQVMGEVMNFSSADLTNLEVAELNINTDSHSSVDQ